MSALPYQSEPWISPRRLDHPAPWTEEDVPAYLRATVVDGTLVISPSPIAPPDVPEDLARRMQIIEGDLYVTPAPVNGHQMLVTILMSQLIGLFPYQEFAVMSAPNVFTYPPEYCNPDVVVAYRHAFDPRALYIDPTGIRLAIEVLSPSTEKLDREKKARIYRDIGIGHYWIADPRTGELFIMHGDALGIPDALKECGDAVREFALGMRP